MNFAQVIFNLAIPTAFTYRIPEEMQGDITPGQRVWAPLAKSELSGIVTNIVSHTNIKNCKDLTDVLDENPVVSQEMLDLTRWIAEYYCSTWGEAVQPALPKNLKRKQQRRIILFSEDEEIIAALTERQRYLYQIIAREPAKTVSFYREKFGIGSFAYILQKLINLNLVGVKDIKSKETLQSKGEKYISVNPWRRDQLKGLRGQDSLIIALEKADTAAKGVADFIKQSGLSPGRIKNLVGRGILSVESRPVRRAASFSYREEQKTFTLNKDQKKAVEEMTTALQKGKYQSFLLHGVTGSGKTQVYLEAIKETLHAGKTAVVLIPEISLTPQTVQRFENYFPGKVAVFHSRMTTSQRLDTWQRIFEDQYPIVVGPRSALFMPLKDIGMIVVDEEHDSSYKQAGNAPRYHARDVAIYRARMNDAVVVLGSATPSFETFYNAAQGKHQLISLPQRIRDLEMPQVQIVDSRALHHRGAKSSVFSNELLEKMADRFAKREQVILLQNRRGYASFLQCVDCGHVQTCPRCAITVTYHKTTRSIQCHYCGYSANAAGSCPKCEGSQVNYRGSGTQKTEQELHKLFPGVKVLRMDMDTTTVKNAHDILLQAFRTGKAQVLLGTQMISKGLDFPEVTLVGVISAELGLTFPDYRAAERTFQLLTQVAGRSGRGDRAGEVVIQSSLVGHYAIEYARHHDFHGFYKEEIKNRSELSYPPHTRLILIRVTAKDISRAIRIARSSADLLRSYAHGIFQVAGPAPSILGRINNMYRWQVLLKIDPQRDPAGKKSKKIIRDQLFSVIKTSSKEYRITIDVDPVDMM